MARFQVDRFLEHDRVSDGTRTGVIFLTYPRKTDGRRFARIAIDGGGEEWPSEASWQPLIDWTKDGQKRRCSDCEREFRISPEEKIWCRTCEAQERTRYDAQAAGAEIRSRFDSPNWKREHRPRRRGF